MVPLLQDRVDVIRLLVPHGLEFFGVRDLEMRAHVIRAIPQTHLESLVPEDFLLLSEDGIGEFGVEGRDRLGAGFRGRNQADAESIVSARQPCEPSVSLNHALNSGGVRVIAHSSIFWTVAMVIDCVRKRFCAGWSWCRVNSTRSWIEEGYEAKRSASACRRNSAGQSREKTIKTSMPRWVKFCAIQPTKRALRDAIQLRSRVEESGGRKKGSTWCCAAQANGILQPRKLGSHKWLGK